MLGHREDWESITNIIYGGCNYPLSSNVTDNIRLSDLRARIERGNHKSADRPESQPIVRDKYKGEVASSWMVPIPVSYLESLQEAELNSIGLAHQTTINEKGEIIEKKTLTHELSFLSESGTSINDRSIDTLLQECVYGQCLRRILHRIHALRLEHPKAVILLAKFDLDAAYRRLASHPKLTVKAITIVGSRAYILNRLPFGATAGPSTYSTVSEMIFDLPNGPP